MAAYSKTLLSASAAVALTWATFAMANENDALQETPQATPLHEQAASSDIETAALATPLPSATKILGPKRPTKELEKDSEQNSLKPKEEPQSSVSEEKPAEKKQKQANPFYYGPSQKSGVATKAPEPETPAVVQDTPEKIQSASNLDIAETIEATLSEGPKTKNKLEKKDLTAISEFYADHDFEPLWTKGGSLTAQTKSLMQRLSKANEDGLDASDYSVEQPLDKTDAKALAGFEIALSKALLHYARDAQAGRIAPSAVSSTFKLRPVYPEPAAVMLKLATSTNKAAALSSYNPSHAEYKALQAELAHLRSLNDVTETITVPSGEPMYKGYRGERVKALRERLNVPILADEESELFDATVKTAVKAFQTENNLIADGIVGARTLLAMNGSQANRIPDIIANMERWRWMARELGDLHVIANVPSYNVTIIKDGENIHRTRAVVGKTKHKTPVFSDEMEFVVVNPYWNVPYSIASKELLPNIRANPSYVRSKNYEILSRGRVINPSSVSWNSNSFKKLRIRQRPGGRNALGRVKFLFPNDYSIYFHDTPSKNLFQRATRAFSHGCVRIHNPFEFGDVLMKQSKGWQNGSLKKLIGSKERWIKLKEDERIPVHITYFTAVSDAEGKISYKSDIYGHNTRMKRALGLI